MRISHFRTCAGRTMAPAAVCIALLGCVAPVAAQDGEVFAAAAVKRPATEVGPRNLETTPSQLTARAASLRYLITQAFEIPDYQLVGTAGWMESELYAIAATAGKTVDHREMMAMLRALLAERFQLKVHKEARQTQVFALVVDKGGSKLQPLADGKMTYPGSQHGENDEMTLAIGSRISDLVRRLNTGTGPNAPGRPVIDETGMQGEYRIWLTFGNEMLPDGRGGKLSIDYRSALPKQLGLRLEPKTAPVEYTVIDSAARPELEQ
jgi:uncharacterized protein (TIGR03435 family)